MWEVASAGAFKKTATRLYYFSIQLNIADTKASVIPFQLGSKIDPGFFQGADALIHCAWDMRATGWDEIHKTNVLGSIRLFEAAANEGVGKLTFISSISAFEGCQSMYGQAKLEVEEAVFKHRWSGCSPWSCLW